MRFSLLDRITDLQPGARITAVKNLSLAEEYLADHFPGFPVMPGVLMLEALTQAGAWLIRASEDFSHSTVLLKAAQQVKYANFVEPGQQLILTAEITAHDHRETKIKAQGTVDGGVAVSARLTLERYNQSDADPSRASADDVMKQKLRELFSLLYRRVQPAA
jgi:3-hydroxyacyl-[acyl-carrier-protein] dehydratase